MQYDIIIIGAGPGGSAAATFLAKKNIKVLLLDKATFPRDKTCGDGLTPRAVAVIERLGVLQQVNSVAQCINFVKIIAPNGRSLTNSLRQFVSDDTPMLATPRYDLDSILIQNAVANGAILQEGCKVTGITDKTDHVIVHGNVQGEKREYSAKYAVVATGASMGLLTKLGFLEEKPYPLIAARAYFENTQHQADHFNFHFNEVTLPGYGWIFPLPNSRVNVGVGIIPKKQGKTINIKTLFDSFATRPYMKEILAGSKQLGNVKSYPIRTDFLTAKLLDHRTLLIGEAAGLANPLTGEGIDYAMESGEIAAEHLFDILNENDDPANLKKYEIKLKEKYTPIFNFSNQITSCCIKPIMLNTVIGVATKKDSLNKSLTNIILGLKEPPEKMSTGRVLKKLFQHLRK